MDIFRSQTWESIYYPLRNVILLALLAHVTTSDVTSIFNDGTSLQKMVLHEQSGAVFIGAENRLYRLSVNMVKEQQADLGPALDSYDCLNPQHECTSERTLRDARVKVLLAAPDEEELLVCVNLYQGSCAKFSAHNLSDLIWVHEPVVGVADDDVFSSTAAVITKKGSLFVANSLNTRNPIVPAHPAAPFLATRNYSNLEIKYRNDYLSSQMNIHLDIWFRAVHRFAFTYKDTAYFLVSEEASRDSGKFATFIGRTCQTDPGYHSYVEAPLLCDTDGIQFNAVEDAYIGTAGRSLAAELRISDQEELLFVTYNKLVKKRLERGRHSGLCVYSLSIIHQKLTNTIQMCYRGRGSTGPFHLTRPLPCKFTNIPIPDDYCGEHSVNYPIRSEEGLTPVASRAFVNTQLSAIVATTVGPYTIAYLGTRNGNIIKVEIHSAHNITIYNSIALQPGQAVLPDMYLSSTGTSLYAVTSAKAFRIQTLNCESHVTCERCMTSSDPHCGWCEETRRCTPQSSCQGDSVGWTWTRTRTARCPAVIAVQPNLTHVSTPIKVNLSLTVLPPRPSETTCAVRVAGGSVRTEAVIVDTKTLQCRSRMTWPHLPSKMVSQDFTIDVEVGKKRWLSASLTVYDCTRYSRCGECVTSTNPCAWCISSSRCVDASTVHLVENCGKENFIYTENSEIGHSSQSYGRGPNFCPRIELLGDKEPLLHSGIPGTVRLAGVHLPREIVNQQIYCRFDQLEVGAAVTPFLGRYNITCEVTELSYKKDVPFFTVDLGVLWGERKSPLDNPYNITLKLYDCEHMATSCGQCLTLDSHFGCGQCEGHCSLREKCPTTWHDRDYICPNPLITRVQPLSGPLGGGTRLTIHGINLGQNIIHVLGHVTVGGHLCEVKHYTPSTSIVCVMPRVPRSTRAQIVVKIAGNYTTHAAWPYFYVDPVLEGIFPTQGPVSGGTNVTLTGRHLDVGTSLEVLLQKTRVKRQTQPSSSMSSPRAFIHRRTNDTVEFETQHVSGRDPVSLHVVVVVDGNRFSNNRIAFSYRENPVIEKVYPTVAIISGSTLVTVEGSSFDLIQKPKLIVYTKERNFVMPCELLANQTDMMTCLTPDVKDLDLGESSPVTLNYGFIMDNVTDLLNVSGQRIPGLEALKVYPDPDLALLPDDIEYDLEKPLTLMGTHLRVLAHFPDFAVTVGGSPCNVTAINDTVIQCLPTTQPEWLNAGKAQVVLEIQSYQVSPGWLRVKGAQPFTMGLTFILAIVAGTIILITFILTICLCRRCREEERRKNKERPVGIEDPAAIPLTHLGTRKEEAEEPQQTTAEVEVTPTEVTPLTAVDGEATKTPEENGELAAAAEPEPGNSYVSLPVEDSVLLKMLLDEVLDPKLQETVQDVLIPRSHLTLGEVLGKGHFGCVYSGTLKSPDNDEEPVEVAIKTLQGRHLDSDAVESFLREGVMMKDFDHPHVLRLLGVSINEQGENPLVVLPFMANGDLRNYVKNKKKSFTARQLLHLGQQVAQGMAYLAQRGFIHRDLAARNCMVDDDCQVKVADFGLSKDLYEKDYYSSADRKRKMPIKWMALESLEDYVFTTKSDVWSFGILLWELMIRGVTPYPDVDAFEMRNYLASGRRLRQPKFCPDNAYILMSECWRTDPDDRPTFADLVNRLELIVNPPKRGGLDTSAEEPLYVNIQRQLSLPTETEPNIQRQASVPSELKPKTKQKASLPGEKIKPEDT